MKKMFKKIISTAVAAVMTVNVISAEAFALGSVSTASTVNLSDKGYHFEVDGNWVNIKGNGPHQGAISGAVFWINKKGKYKISFTGAQNAGATVIIYKFRVDKPYDYPCDTILIPQYASGMPTLYVYTELEPGNYRVRVVSSSNKEYAIGGLTIHT